MSKNLAAHGDEGYINMELNTSPPSKPPYTCSPQFEFQMFSTSTSTAADLFHNGRLLPLAAASATAPCTYATNTPLSSCNISPSESCRVSCELIPDDSFFAWSPANHHPRTRIQVINSSSVPDHHQKKPKKSKPIKQSALLQKLKSSKAYLKSLFTKSDSDEDKYSKIGRKIAAIIKNIDDENGHRRSFSGAIKRHSPSSSSSSSSSFSSSSKSAPLDLPRRTSSATEVEVSIDAAIAHCKNSMQSFRIGDDMGREKV